MKKVVLSFLLTLIFSFLLSLFMARPAYAQVSPDQALQIIAENLKFSKADEMAWLATETATQDETREFVHSHLYSEESGDIQILISGPIGFRAQNVSYPVLFISAGFASGMESIRLFGNPGNVIVVGFQYPHPQKEIEKDLSLLPKLIRIVPGQMALTLQWLSQRPYVDTQRIHVMGVSLGSLFLPVSLRLAQLRNVHPRTTTLAFGGSNLNIILENFLTEQAPDWIRIPLLEMLNGIFTLHNPKLHLPFLTGKFNCIYATNDNIFPRASSLEQFELLTGEKEIHWIEGPHIDVDQPQIIHETTTLVLDFLKRTDSLPSN